MITIDPLSPVVRSGETVRLMCRADGPIRSCLWQINNDLYTLGEGQRFQPYGQLSDGECGIQVSTGSSSEPRSFRAWPFYCCTRKPAHPIDPHRVSTSIPIADRFPPAGWLVAFLFCRCRISRW